MNARVESRLPGSLIWAAWKKSHLASGLTDLEPGKKGTIQASNKAAGLKYQIEEVIEGKSFSILWKASFVRLIFSYEVKPTARGSEVSCSAKVRGFLAWPVQWLLRKKIQKNLTHALTTMVKQLESAY